MKTNITGKLRNLNLPATKCLLPLFESIANSIDSIEESKRKDGKIEITIQRCSEYQESIVEQAPPEVYAFEVKDNGVGFNQQNFESFCTADSTFKIKKGGKGLGRFSWLKAFEKVEIKSQFKENNNYWERNFLFDSKGDGVHGHENKSLEKNGNLKTTVKLINFKKQYVERCPKNLETIARKIIGHFLVHFHSKSLPIIEIKDNETTVCLNDIFEREIAEKHNDLSFDIKGKTFKYHSSKVFIAGDGEHKISFFANNREVEFKQLKELIPEIGKNVRKFCTLDQREYFYLGCVSGQYLDECVNQERTGFDLYGSDDDLYDSISKEDIDKKLASIVKEDIKDDLSHLNIEKIRKYESYINEKAPQYKILLRHRRSHLELLSSGLSDSSLEMELHQIMHNWEIEVRSNNERFLKQNSKNIEDLNKYTEEREKRILEENEIGQYSLAKYVAHRKAVLEFLESSLQIQKNGKYHKEARIHDIIFPRNSTSQDVRYENQNLWIIDEKLSYHKFLASDKPIHNLTDIGDFDKSEKDRPDIIILNENTTAWTSDENSYYNSIIVIEIKRPNREDYPDDEIPSKQLLSYIQKLRSGKTKDVNGRTIQIKENTIFFGYVICDITEKIKEYVNHEDYKPLPDQMGYFDYHQAYRAYLEIISFEKLLQDARKRNKILFDKLNLL